MLEFIGISDVTFVDAEGTVSDLDAAPTGAQTQIEPTSRLPGRRIQVDDGPDRGVRRRMAAHDLAGTQRDDRPTQGSLRGTRTRFF